MIDELALAIARLPADEFWLYFAVVCVTSAFSLYLFFRYWWRYRMMQDTPTAKIRSAAQGYNEFSGVAKMLPGEPIVAPLTRLNCVWYQYKVEEKQSRFVRGRSRTSWHVYETGVSDSVFSLHGTTGKALVDPDDAEVIYSVSDTWYGSTPYPSAGPAGFSSRRLAIGRRYRYSEQRIHHDDPLYVLGHFKSFHAMELPSKRESLAALLQSWKKDPQALLRRFDENQDGEIDSVEWEKAVFIAKKEIHHEAIKGVEQQGHIIEKPETGRKPFLISTTMEPQLLRRFQYQSYLALGLFFLLGLAATWGLNSRI